MCYNGNIGQISYWRSVYKGVIEAPGKYEMEIWERSPEGQEGVYRMKKWNTKYHGIGLKFEPHIVRIRNDEILRFFLTHQKAACQRLANAALKAYRLKYGTELDISQDSLATEIWLHYRIKRISLMLEGTRLGLFQRPAFRNFLDKVLVHMAVIDCGERKCDNNRWLWDLLSRVLPVPYKK